jgi:dethiobiotin synthetase
MIEERPIDLTLVREAFDRLKGKHQAVVVEGVGGWNVPITRDYYIRDLARDFALPVYVVAANRLGALNHTILTVEAVKQSGLRCLGVIWNDVAGVTSPDPATATNRAVLEALMELPQTFAVEFGQSALRESDSATVLSGLRQA